MSFWTTTILGLPQSLIGKADAGDVSVVCDTAKQTRGGTPQVPHSDKSVKPSQIQQFYVASTSVHSPNYMRQAHEI